MEKPLNVTSLGYRTDLIFASFAGEITDRGDYLVVRTPSNPSYWWGNFLLFASPPGAGDAERWTTLFGREIGEPPTVNHMVFGWDTVNGEAGEVAGFLERGFSLSREVVLTARAVVKPPKCNEAAEVRRLERDEDWAAALELGVACRDAQFEEASHRVYLSRKLADYRAMSRAGLGAWHGAFLEGRLVAGLGLFFDANASDGAVGRFQSVETHPDFRRRGLCGRLVFEVAREALATSASTLVMIADEDYHAAKIYESVGFEPAERQVALERWNP